MATTNTGATGSSQSSHSHSEVGHIKNVANFNVLINTSQGFGASYNPTNALITVTALQALYTAADNAVTNSVNLGNTQQQFINSRLGAFVDVKAKAARIMAALVASGADAATIKNAKTLLRKIQGRRAVPVVVSPNSGGNSSGGTIPNPNPVNTTPPASSQKQSAAPTTTQPIVISVSQQSYDRLVSNFKALVNYVSQISGYNPNETDLQITALNAYVVMLQVANNGVITAHVNYNNAVTLRTKVLYDATTGLVQIALEVKQYIKSVFGSSSLQFKQANHIKFRNLVRK